MTVLEITADILEHIHAHGERSYPEEGAGLMLGRVVEGKKQVVEIVTYINAREASARHNRYLITPEDMLRGEQEAIRLGLDIVGVFHSHPNHPNQPSEFDREWALPWFSYLITSVQDGQAIASRSWQLIEDRSGFHEEVLVVKHGLVDIK